MATDEKIAALPDNATLMVIDLQRAIDAAYWAKDGPRNNPNAETVVARLLAAWRAAKRAIIHVRHDSQERDSAYRPGQPGHGFKPEAMPLPGETVLAKRTNSAFIGTDLEPRLRAQRCDTLVICGAITNNSVEATVRMAGNLGFRAYLVEDACFTFARKDFDGRIVPAGQVHALSLANMAGEYATVVSSDAVLAAL